MDTIYAEATPPGRGGVSIVRLSGPAAHEIGEAIAGRLDHPREAYLRPLRDGELIDMGLVLRFDEAASFTGEKVVEFHLHGAPVVVRRLEQALRRRGARLAEAGEFTRRGFLNGAIPLSQAEALSDLLAAETEAQRSQAMRIVSGELTRWTDELRDKLVRAGALIEVSLDFADEEVPEDVPAEVFTLFDEVRASIAAQLAGMGSAEQVRSGFEVAIVGPPNAGKSSLLNRIAHREVALVSEQPGTTRDIIEVRTELGGLSVTFLDTAGLRDTEDRIEAMGVARALDRAAAADLRIHLITEEQPRDDLVRDEDLVLRSKADIQPGDISAVTGFGLEDLLERVTVTLRERVAGAGLITRRRQAEALQDAWDVLNLSPHTPAEIFSEAVRRANQRLEEVIGRVCPDDYLDEIFSRFCIGK